MCKEVEDAVAQQPASWLYMVVLVQNNALGVVLCWVHVSSHTWPWVKLG